MTDYIHGRGSQVNTNNPFTKTEYVAEHIEGLDEPMLIKPDTQVFYESPKKIVNKVDSPDVGMTHSLNPYQGCEHGCVYCYARNSHQYWGFSAGLDFESKIVVKRTAPELLEKLFLSKSWKPAVIALSGNTDCYQPLERKFKLTRALLEIALKYRNPIGIITKNSLIERDIDLLSELARLNLLHVNFSITSLDPKLRTLMEPRTATANRKFKAIEKLSKAGIPVNLMNAPIIPGLTDHETPEIIKRAAESGARTAGYTMVRLNGSVALLFKDWLYKNFPDKADKVWSQIGEVHGGEVNDSVFGRRMKGSGEIAAMIKQLFESARKKHMAGGQMPTLDFTQFRKGGNYNLF